MVDYKITELILQQLKHKGMKQSDLARQLAVADYSVSRWCTGRTIPDANTFLNIAHVLDIPIDDKINTAMKFHNETEIITIYRNLNDYEKQCLMSIIRTVANISKYPR